MTVLEEIAAERARQISAEGWTPAHDDTHNTGDLAAAAACYAYGAAEVQSNYLAMTKTQTQPPLSVWPWLERWWKFTDPRRALIKAGALIVAEIERLDRANAQAASGSATVVSNGENERPK